MKKIKYLIIIVVAVVGSVSCNNDDDNLVNPLVGSWGWVEDDEAPSYEYSFTITFNANSSGQTVSVETRNGEANTVVTPMTWSTDGNQLTTTSLNGGTGVTTYSISGNSLTLTYDGETDVLTRQ